MEHPRQKRAITAAAVASSNGQRRSIDISRQSSNIKATELEASRHMHRLAVNNSSRANSATRQRQSEGYTMEQCSRKHLWKSPTMKGLVRIGARDTCGSSMRRTAQRCNNTTHFSIAGHRTQGERCKAAQFAIAV